MLGRIKGIMHWIYLLICFNTFDILLVWGVTENGKRFAFRQDEYVLRTSSVFGGDTNGK